MSKRTSVRFMTIQYAIKLVLNITYFVKASTPALAEALGETKPEPVCV